MGFFIDVFVLVAAILLILFVITQVIYPMFTGEPMFSFFFKSEVKMEIEKAEHVLESVAETAHLKKVAAEIERQAAQLKEPK